MTEDGYPETLDERCEHILRHVDAIYVREQVNGKWGSHSLAELPANKALEHAFRWIREGITPTRVLTEDERKKRPAGKVE